MDRTVRVSFRISAQQAERLAECAQAEGLPLEQFLDLALDKALRSSERSRKAKNRAGGDEPLLSRLRVIVAQAIDGARDWQHLQDRLAAEGLRFAPAGAGLELRSLSPDRRLFKASEVGPSYSALIRRFGCGFPGHPHPWLVPQALGFLDGSDDGNRPPTR
ncbi:MAG: hypothetical protein MRY63_02135 [Neomegalonema sp.]|nr:hypothetical protein [Neomegalonema sp.]